MNIKKVLIVLSIFLVLLSGFASCSVAAEITNFHVGDDTQGLISQLGNSNQIPNAVEYDGNTYTLAQINYILPKAISMIASGEENAVITIPDYPYCQNPDMGADIPQKISEVQYIDMANRYATWTEAHKLIPNYVGINVAGEPDVSTESAPGLWIDILDYYYSNGELPAIIQYRG